MRKRFSVEEKVSVVMAGLRRDTNLAQLCNKYKISKTQFYRWRNKFIEGGRKALEDNRKTVNNRERKIRKLENTTNKQSILIGILKERYSTKEQKQIVDMLVGEMGFTISEALSCIGMSKSTYYYSTYAKKQQFQRNPVKTSY